ncbi:DUF6685 family protein (plasmid) [Massilia varians]
MSLIQTITDHVRESLGHQVRLRRVLGERPELKASVLAPENNIDMDRVPRWHQMGTSPGLLSLAGGRTSGAELRGWRREGTQYRSFTESCPALAELTTKSTLNTWFCDLQDLHGFGNSKSDLKSLSSTDEMVEKNSREMIEDVSLAGLHANLAHRDIRVTGERAGTDYFVMHQWDGRMYLANDGGSHHLAAAKYIAARIDAKVPLYARLHYYAVDRHAVGLLRSTYDTYLVKMDPNNAAPSNELFEALQSGGVTWLSHELPAPYEGTRAVFLPRDNEVSMRASQLFREAGFVDLGQHLQEVANRPMPPLLLRQLGYQNDMAPDEEESEGESSAPRA